MSIWTERNYLVGDEDSGAFMTVSPAPDYPESGVLLAAIGDKSENEYGKIYIQLSTEYMRAIGMALVACADDVDRENKK